MNLGWTLGNFKYSQLQRQDVLIKDRKSKNQQCALGKSNAEERMAIESEKETEEKCCGLS